MFETARYQVPNPGRHRRTTPRYGLIGYAITLKQVLEAVLARPNLLKTIDPSGAEGRNCVNRHAASRLLCRIAPRRWGFVPPGVYPIWEAAV
jgi:hypothetical protein